MDFLTCFLLFVCGFLFFATIFLVYKLVEYSKGRDKRRDWEYHDDDYSE